MKVPPRRSNGRRSGDVACVAHSHTQAPPHTHTHMHSPRDHKFQGRCMLECAHGYYRGDGATLLELTCRPQSSDHNHGVRTLNGKNGKNGKNGVLNLDDIKCASA